MESAVILKTEQTSRLILGKEIRSNMIEIQNAFQRLPALGVYFLLGTINIIDLCCVRCVVCVQCVLSVCVLCVCVCLLGYLFFVLNEIYCPVV